jgi:hypothetical protein
MGAYRHPSFLTTLIALTTGQKQLENDNDYY